MSTATYIPRLYDFLRRLGANNNRQWFADNKEEYLELRGRWMEDLDRLIGAMTAYEPRLAGQSARTSAYRIYRDTRFSPDKTPYKTYFRLRFPPTANRLKWQAIISTSDTLPTTARASTAASGALPRRC